MNDEKQGVEAGSEGLLEYADSIIATLREPFLVLDKKLRVISANHAFFVTFGVAEKETLGRSLPSLGNKQWDIPKLRQLLQEIIPQDKVVHDYEVEHTFSLLGPRVMRLNACQLRVPKKIAAMMTARVIGGGRRAAAAAEEEEELILLAIEDITERQRLKNELQQSEERFRRAFETSRDGLLLVHKIEADILNANASIQELLGYSELELLKKKLWEVGVTRDGKDFQETLSRLEKDGIIHYEDMEVKTKAGRIIHTEIFLLNRAKVMQCNIRDITESKKIQNELKEKMRSLEQFSKFAVDRELKMEELERKEIEMEKKLKNR
jgi:PAS domain S-box-containing protein